MTLRGRQIPILQHRSAVETREALTAEDLFIRTEEPKGPGDSITPLLDLMLTGQLSKPLVSLRGSGEPPSPDPQDLMDKPLLLSSSSPALREEHSPGALYVSVSGDDVFDEDVDDITLQNKEWKHNMEKRVKDGYVEGIDTAKAKFLQLGFNLGYREGAEKTVALGRLKGVVSAIQCWCQQRPAPHNSSPVSVSGLLQRVEQHEERLMKEMRQALEKPPMATSSSDSLGVHPGEEEDGCCGRGGKEEGAGGCVSTEECGSAVPVVLGAGEPSRWSTGTRLDPGWTRTRADTWRPVGPMENWFCCCHSKTPCASLEERSGLLDVKTAAPGDPGRLGLCQDSPSDPGRLGLCQDSPSDPGRLGLCQDSPGDPGLCQDSPSDPGRLGLCQDSPDSESGVRKVSMEEIKGEEMKEEKMEAEEQMVVTAQVRRGENTPNLPQENGVVQKGGVRTEAVAPPPSAPPDSRRQKPPASEYPGVAETGAVVVAAPEKQTAEVVEETSPPPGASQDVPGARRGITSSAADPVSEAAGEWENAPGLSPDQEMTSPPELPPSAACGSSPQEIWNNESSSRPRSLLTQATPSRTGQSTFCSVFFLLSPSAVMPAEAAVSQPQVCGEVAAPQTVPDIFQGAESTSPPGDPPSEVLVPETTSQSKPVSMKVEEADLHPDHALELRDPQESLEKPLEEDPSVGSQNPIAPLPALETRDEDREQEVVHVEQEVVLKGGSEEKEEEEAVQVMVDKSVSMETRVGGEEEEAEQELSTAPAGDDKEGEEDDDDDDEEEEEPSVDQVEDGDEDLYRGVEDVDSSPASLEGTLVKVEGSCSLAPAVDLLSYSQREWRGNTTKSALIRKGYQQVMEWFGGVRRVRGDNYCALRATLFQVLSQTTQCPAWLCDDHVAKLPEELEGPEGLLSHWAFPGECQLGDRKRDATQRLEGYIELLRKTWRSAAACGGAEARRRLCEAVFQGGEEELGMLEAVKLLMLRRAAELHRLMAQGHEVPVFCWLLFARDTSPCPRTLLTNHLRHVGFSGGLEQVEMFLLGYTLHCTIQVYHLYLSGTDEFLTYYPDDHRDDWPSVSLVTEDDRHYNVLVIRAAAAQEAASR
ncbi:unnamed protein product [Merluccius merluccius]